MADGKAGLSGPSLGHYLSACAMMSVSTGDKDLKKSRLYSAGLARCQQARKMGVI